MSTRSALFFLLVLTFLNGMVWSAAVPLWQGTDENGHFAATQFVAEHLRLPGPADGFRSDEIVLAGELADVRKLPYRPHLRQAFGEGPDGPNEAELRALGQETRTSYELRRPGKLNHTSPLYYILGAVAYRLAYGADLLGRLFALRAFSVLLTVGMVGVSYGLVSAILPGETDVALTVAALVSFQPMLTYIGAIVNNDILVALLTTAAVWVLVRIWRDGVNSGRAVALGACLGLGMLAKPLISGLALPVALVYGREWWQRRGRRWRVIGLGVLSLVVALALCGWWQVRSLRLNDGSLYMDEIAKGYRIIDEPFFDYCGRPLKHAVDYWASIAGGVWGSYWAAFGWLDAPAPRGLYWVVDAVTVLGLAGAVVYGVRAARRGDKRSVGILLLLAVVVLAPLVMLQVYDFTYWCANGGGRGLQGRYFFGQMAVLFTLVVGGLLALAPRRWHGAVHVVLRVGIVVANLYCLLHVVLPRYYG